MRESYLLTAAERNDRMAFALVCWGLMALGLYGLCSLFLYSYWALGVALSMWFALFGMTWNLFLVSVPEVCGLVTVNYFKSPTPDDKYAKIGRAHV